MAHTNMKEMAIQDLTAVRITRAHVDAWSHHDWDRTRELLAPNVHVVGTTPPMLPSEEAVLL